MNKYCVDGFKSTIPTGNQIEMMSPNSPKPDFPEYRLLSERIKSFIDNGWPRYLEQTPLDMSMAGFFYTGREDRTICFNCGGGLMKWEKKDDPFKHHAIWYNHCSYIQAIRPMSEKELQRNFLKRPHPSSSRNIYGKQRKSEINYSIADAEL